MSTTPQPDRAAARRPAPAHRDPADLAPSVERGWADGFILEQRLLGVPGERIGDALVTVESHVVESGESAHEAFGDPSAYARELAQEGPPAEPAVTARAVVANVLGVLGMLLSSYAFGAWLRDEPAAVTVGLVVSTALVLATLGGFLAAATPVLRLVLERPWLAAVSMSLLVAAVVALLVLLPGVLVEVPASLLLGVGLLMVLADALLSWFEHGTDDTVLAPGESSPRRPDGRLAVTLFVPVATALLLGLAWVIHLLS